MLRSKLLATAIATPIALASFAANALPVTFSSNGSFANPTGCSAHSPACTVQQNGNRLILGTSTFFVFPTTPYSTLTAVDIGTTSTTTPQNDFRIGEIDWVNVPTTNTDPNFNDTYSLTLNFTAPGVTSATTSVNLNIRQPTNPPGDSITQLLLNALDPLEITFAGLQVSDVKFVLGSAGPKGSTFNPVTGHWYNPENNTAKLYITADFTAVPEPASLALLGFGTLALGMVHRRRTQS